jgi:peptidoglycan hydrolase-like protein with peptidoglycan-binding domain
MTEASQRQAWKAFDGNESQIIDIAFGPDRLKVARPTEEAWQALHAVVQAHEYEIRPDETHGYAQRNIKGTSTKSLHAFGLAIDINAPTNPMRETPDRRKVRFSGKPTQRERARDVVLHEADTDMTPAMIADILAIRTKNGKQVFGWGGNWNTRKDTMHFYVDVPPADLETGIDWSTVRATSRELGDPWPELDRGGSWQDMRGNWGEFDMASGFDELAPRVMERLIADFDLTPEQAAGIVGNLGAESGLKAVLGWAQWTGPRRVAFERWCQEKGLDIRNTEANYGYLRAELSGDVPGSDYRNVITQLKRTTTLEEAVKTFENLFEKAAADAKRMSTRISFARRALELHQRQGRSPETPDSFPHRPPGIPAELWDIIMASLRRHIPEAPGDDALTLQFGDEGTPVRELQKRLTELDYHTGGIDGIFGTLTRRAVAAFQVENQIHGTGIANAATRTAIMGSQASRFAPGRESATAADLRRLGSREVVNADRVRYASWGTGALGALGMGQNVFGSGSLENALRAFIANKDQLSKVFGPDFSPAAVTKAQDFLTSNAASAKIGPIADVVMPLISGLVPGGLAGSLLALALGVGGHVLGSNIIDRRVQLQRDGRHIGAVGL